MKLQTNLALVFLLAAGCASHQNQGRVIHETETTRTETHVAPTPSTNQPTVTATAPQVMPSEAATSANSSASASSNAPVPTLSQPATAFADRNVVSSIQFEPGREGLSPEATAELNRMIMQAKENGRIADVNVAVWSDLENTAHNGPKLPAEQVDIANQRARNIQKYIDRMEPEANVKVYNMAQQPAPFANLLQHEDPTVKNQVAALGIATDPSGQEVKGRSSSAVVIIQVK